MTPSFDPADFAAWLADQADLGTKWSPTYRANLQGTPHRRTRQDRSPADPPRSLADRRPGLATTAARNVIPAAHRRGPCRDPRGVRRTAAASPFIRSQPMSDKSSRSRVALADGFTRWFADQHPDRTEIAVAIQRPQTGLSSDTLMLEVKTATTSERYVARLPPPGETAFPDYDLAARRRCRTPSPRKGSPRRRHSRSRPTRPGSAHLSC